MSQYVIRIACCALICGALASISQDGSGVGRIVYSLFLAFMVISPLKELKLDEMIELPQVLYREGEIIRDKANEKTDEEIQRVIKEELESYILVEADLMGVELCVEKIELDENTMLPVKVFLSGSADGDKRQILAAFLTQELGIGEEGQIWNGET